MQEGATPGEEPVELREAIASRRSTRTYSPEPVGRAIVEELVLQATAAPSACNRQGWRFIHLGDRADLDWLHRRGGSLVLRSARQALLVCYQRNTDNAEWQDNIQSAAAAIAYFQLLAHEMGIGSCWICHLPPPREIVLKFGLPPAYMPVAVVTFGYYKEDRTERESSVNSRQRLLAMDRWDFPVEETDTLTVAFMVRTALRKFYYVLPFRSLLRKWVERYEKKFDE